MDVSSSGRSTQLIFLRRVLHKCFAIIKRENKQHGAELICGHLYGGNGVACASRKMRTRQTNLQERKFTPGRGGEDRRRKICVVVLEQNRTFCTSCKITSTCLYWIFITRSSVNTDVKKIAGMKNV